MHVVVLCLGVLSANLPISFMVNSLALEQTNECPGDSEVALKNMDKVVIRIHHWLMISRQHKAFYRVCCADSPTLQWHHMSVYAPQITTNRTVKITKLLQSLPCGSRTVSGRPIWDMATNRPFCDIGRDCLGRDGLWAHMIGGKFHRFHRPLTVLLHSPNGRQPACR